VLKNEATDLKIDECESSDDEEESKSSK